MEFCPEALGEVKALLEDSESPGAAQLQWGDEEEPASLLIPCCCLIPEGTDCLKGCNCPALCCARWVHTTPSPRTSCPNLGGKPVPEELLQSPLVWGCPWVSKDRVYPTERGEPPKSCDG